MAKKAQAEFLRWFGPLLDALRDLGDSGRPREVSARIARNLNDEVLSVGDAITAAGSLSSAARAALHLCQLSDGLSRPLNAYRKS